MKKLFLILLLGYFPIQAQIEKGKLSLIFNGEHFNIPINMIDIRKENNLLISVRAEKNDSAMHQMISLEFQLGKLAADNKINSLDVEGFRIQIMSTNHEEKSGKNFHLNILDGGSFEYFNRGERMTWEFKNVQMKMNIDDVKYTGERLIITGKFEGEFRSSVTSDINKNSAEIKEGLFEIVM